MTKAESEKRFTINPKTIPVRMDLSWTAWEQLAEDESSKNYRQISWIRKIRVASRVKP